MTRKLLTLGVAALALCVCANADIIPSLDSGNPVDLMNGTFAFNYTLSLSNLERLDPVATSSTTCPPNGNTQCNPPGTFFTIYDIPGFVSANTVASGWKTTLQLTGITPSLENPGDSGLPNVTFTYTGPVVNGPVEISSFQIISTDSVMAVGTYASQATENIGILSGTTDQAIGSVEIPAGTSSVPEPASLTLISVGLVGLAVTRKRFNR
jgi:PEP-CTERM motif